MPYRSVSSYAFVCPLAILAVGCGDLESSSISSNGQELVAQAPIPLVEAPDPVADRNLAGVRQRVAFGRTPGSLVELEDGRSIDPAVAGEQILTKHHQFESDLESVRDALHGEPETTREFVETGDSLMLIAQTKLVVSDPERLRREVPELSSYFNAQTSAPFASLDKQQQGAISALLKKSRNLEADHPLAVASKKGPQAFLDAMGEGVGDLIMTTSIRIPKEPMQQQDGAWLTPQAGAAQGFDFSHFVPVDSKFSAHQAMGHGTLSDALSAEDDQESLLEIWNGEPGTSGQDHSVRRFINGFTLGDALEHELTWTFTGGHFSIGVYAWYGVGLRVPIKMTGDMNPTQITVVDDEEDQEVDFESEITIEVLDADEDFYERAGMPSDLIFDGNEIVFEAGAHAEIELRTPIVNIDEHIPRYPLGVDKSRDLAPPFDPECGTECGVYVWLPASLTNTQIGIKVLGAEISGTAQVGANIGGTGQVELTYESLFEGDVISSERISSGDVRNSHQLSFSKPGDRKFRTTLPRLREHGSVPFGYQVSDVDYIWNVVITPAVKGNISVDAWPFFDLDYSLGPYDLNGWALRPGDITLGTHAGTEESQSVVEGEKSFLPMTHQREDLTDASNGHLHNAQGR